MTTPDSMQLLLLPDDLILEIAIRLRHSLKDLFHFIRTSRKIYDVLSKDANFWIKLHEEYFTYSPELTIEEYKTFSPEKFIQAYQKQEFKIRDFSHQYNYKKYDFSEKIYLSLGSVPQRCSFS